MYECNQVDCVNVILLVFTISGYSSIYLYSQFFFANVSSFRDI